ncbi:hypothetical protein B0H14DRAFT_2334299, partial [Mycena olivaceomarginata]
PSIFGALPYPMPHKPTPTFLNPITFTFSNPGGTILNSAVTGPQSQRYFSVTTDSTKGGFSIVQNFGGESIAVIEWRKHPVVEITFDEDQVRTIFIWKAEHNTGVHRFRLMAFQGYYRWTPHDRYIRVRGILTGTIIEVAVEALKLGLLKVLVVATLLLMCGRNID